MIVILLDRVGRGLTSLLHVLHNSATMPHVTQDVEKTGKKTAMLGYTSRSLIYVTTFGIVIVTAICTAVYFYLQYQNTQDQLNRTTQSNEQAALVREVGKLIVLPTGEQPNIATVSDISKLKGQPFFTGARNGDKVLIYTKAQKAILYDPIANKIVEVGPISVAQATPVPAAVAAARTGPTLSPVRVALYNGTSVVGLAATVAKQLQEDMPSVTVVTKADAQKSTYMTPIIVDLTGKNALAAQALAKELKGKIGTLPAGETKPANADLLVILGK
ncbi:MAG TPA: LytR C-terminal domain-containing protein [Candidatus Acidoferrales bacterium]|nr:LytR C-terminal domain-containing protein [Candidatus Acidoferrales bacterium]